MNEWWIKIKEFVTSRTGLIVVISSGVIIALILITSIIYTVKKVKKEKEENPYIEANKQNFYEKENNKSFINNEPSIYNIPSKEIKNSDGNSFNIGLPNLKNDNTINKNNMSFTAGLAQAHTKNSTP